MFTIYTSFGVNIEISSIVVHEEIIFFKHTSLYTPNKRSLGCIGTTLSVRLSIRPFARPCKIRVLSISFLWRKLEIPIPAKIAKL